GGSVGVGTSTPTSTFQVAGSQAVSRTAVAADYALGANDYYVGVTGGAAPVTLTLPSAAGIAGRVYVVKDEAGAASARPITVRAQPGQAIDGVASVSIASNYGALQLISSGSQWFIMSGAYTPGASVTTAA